MKSVQDAALATEESQNSQSKGLYGSIYGSGYGYGKSQNDRDKEKAKAKAKSNSSNIKEGVAVEAKPESV